MRLIRTPLAALVLTTVAHAALAQGLTLMPSSPVMSGAATTGGMDSGGGLGNGAGAGTGMDGSLLPAGRGRLGGNGAQGIDPANPNANQNNPQQQGDSNGSNGADAADSADNGDGDLGSGTLRTKASQNEFQRFVQASTGQRLPLFGERYFKGSPKAFAANDKAPVPADYVLGPGDELQIRAWGSVDVDYRAVLNRDGQISLPKVGTFGLAGVKFGEVENLLRSQIGRIYKNFSLNVTMGRLRTVQIFIVGQARRPGSYTVSSLATLVNVIFMSGGPGPNGSLRHVQLKRDGKLLTELDLYDFIVNGSKDKDVRILPGDTLVYLPTGPQVALLGSLDMPAVYELKDETESIGQLLTYGGGTHATTNLQTALLERLDTSNAKAPRSVSTVDLGKAGTTTLRDGDILTLFGVAPQFANAVTLRGNVAAPLRYPFTPGMRISQVIPDRDALVTPDYYTRKNKLVQFVETRDVSEGKLSRDIRNLVDEPNWEYAAIERFNADRVSMKLLPFNLAKAVIDKDPAHDLELQAGDVITIFSRDDIRNPIATKTRLVRVEGEVRAPGIYPLQPGDTLRDLIARAGGATNEAYLYGLEFSREETRRAQAKALAEATRRLESQMASSNADQVANLTATDAGSIAQLRMTQTEMRKAQLANLKGLKPNGRISLELDTSIQNSGQLPEVPLEDGDIISIPHRPGFIFTVGSVANTNGQLWRPGRTLRQYLDNAGVEPDADQDNIFVARADGSVVHNNRRGWFNTIEKIELMPGDTVVVPDRANRETTWTAITRGLKDWSQILYQFGLTAAAIKTLKN